MPTFSVDNEEFGAQVAALAERRFSASALVSAGHLQASETGLVERSGADNSFDLGAGLAVVGAMAAGQRPRNEDLVNYVLARGVLCASTAGLDDASLGGVVALVKAAAGDNALALCLLVLAIVDNALGPDSSAVATALEAIHKGLNGAQQGICVQLLKELVSIKAVREAYLEKYGSSEIVELLAGGVATYSLQMKYTLVFIVWCFSFSAKFSPKEVGILVPLLFRLAKEGVKEKVVRLSISTLLNMATSETILKKYLLCGGVGILKSLGERKWSDEELKEDLDTLRVRLEESVANLTTWDEYAEELRGGAFNWSPTHTSDEFWLDNSGKFKENAWAEVKAMVKLLEKGTAANEDQLYLNQAIVCFDLAKIIELLPEVIVVLGKIGAKTKIMTLMNSPNASVKYEALKTTQLLVSKSI